MTETVLALVRAPEWTVVRDGPTQPRARKRLAALLNGGRDVDMKTLRASHVRGGPRGDTSTARRVQLATGLTALSRCAIPHEMVTTDRVAKSHSIIRSSRRVWRSSGGVGLGQQWGRAARCLVCVRPSLSATAWGEARRATASEPPHSD